MSRNVNICVECPFFVEEPGCDKLSGAAKRARDIQLSKRIRCEGIHKGGKIFLEFASKAERDEHRENFCYSNCWQGCPIANMLYENYDENLLKKR